jgi:hypothetical protein
MTVTKPQQLTLWPDDALPGQLSLFNRKAEVGVLSEEVSRYCERCESVVVRHFPGHLCFHCETVLAEFLANRQDHSEDSPPATEPVWEPDDWFGKRPPMDVVPAASAYL